MGKWKDVVIDGKAPDKETKKFIRKEAYKKMGGITKRERISNFFTNRTGYYAWKEIFVNYLLIIFALMTLVALIFCLVKIKEMTIETLITDPGFQCISIGGGVFIICLIEKIRFRKQRFKCYINNGVSNKYVFWKDDKTNPKNKSRSRKFE